MMSLINPFYQSPVKSCETTPNRPVRYRRETNEEKLKIVEVAKEVGIRKAAKLFDVKSPASVHRWMKQEKDLKREVANKNKKVIFSKK